ncbi:MAG: Uma2 family endonuclease [Planctomycetes bacterium]|nr:Uma2 family endonuclease [Planctomycetota bacterium]
MSTSVIHDPAPVATSGDDEERYEVVDGQRMGLPPMAFFSAWLASLLLQYVAPHVRKQDLGWAVCEALFHLPAPTDRDRRPDLAFVSYQRWAKNRPFPRTENALDVVPNLATEVVSPTDIAEDLTEKIHEYFRAGVELVWVVYPLQQEIYVYRSPTQITVLTAAEELDGGTVLPGFRLPLADFFRDAVENAAAP